MASQKTQNLEDAILDIAYGNEDLALQNSLALDLSILPFLANHLSNDLPISILERFETILKGVMLSAMRGKVAGETARELTQFQIDIGLLRKYKSYSIKCASPLGYSIFLQNEREGFSFQRHVTHKTEVFHILDVMPGGYVFICDFEEWRQCYEPESFANWLAGNEDERYERFRFRPQAGDVFTIDELGVVHSVVGCVLEEFATVSTDMVDRLHDQNRGAVIPACFNRSFVQARLAQLSLPHSSRHVNIRSSVSVRGDEIPVQKISGGTTTPLARNAMHATRYMIEPRRASDLFVDEERASSIYIAEGSGRIVVADSSEAASMTPPTISVVSGNLLLIPPGIHYGFVNEVSEPLKLSEHKIALSVAFATQ